MNTASKLAITTLKASLATPVITDIPCCVSWEEYQFLMLESFVLNQEDILAKQGDTVSKVIREKE